MQDGRIDIVKRRVSMTGDVWHEDPKLVVVGLITKRIWYRGRKGERVDGYEVRWSDNVRENWPYECLLPCLIPETEKSLVSAMRSASLNAKASKATKTSEGAKASNGAKASEGKASKGVHGKNVPDDIADPEKDEYEGEYMTDGDSDALIDPQDC